MGTEPAAIEKEIEVTRARLGEDLDLLQEKVSPSKAAHRATHGIERRVSEVADSLRPKAEAAAEKAKKTAGQAFAPVRRQLNAHPQVAETVRKTREGAGATASAVRTQAGRSLRAAGALVGGTTLAGVTAVVVLARHRRHAQSYT